MPLKSQWKKNVVNEHKKGVVTNKTHTKGMAQRKSTKGDAQSQQTWL